MLRLWHATNLYVRLAALGVVAAGLWVAWYLGSPLFIDQVVDESFPARAPAAQSQPATAPVLQRQPTAAPAGQPQAAGAAAPAQSGPAVQVTVPAAAATAAPAAPKVDAPVALSSGQFGEIDSVHKGEGKATFYQLPDGQRVLRLEDFKVTNGPDLFVYLSAHPAPRTSEQLHQGAAVEVARLKGNIGSQNYELPADLDLAPFKSVIIYCKQFSVVFSTAELMLAP